MMKMDLEKIEFDLEELAPLLLSDKQEAFRFIGEKFLNAVLERGFSEYIGAYKHERSDERVDYRNSHKGIKKAAKVSFIGSSWQLCSVQLKRNVKKIVPKTSE